MSYPETAVILITCHGKMKVKATNFEHYSFHVPDNMSLTILNAVAPGICNFLESKDANDFATKLIKKIKEDEEGVHLLESDPSAFVNSLINTLKEYDKNMKNDVIYHNLRLKNVERDIDEEEYIHHDDKSYNIFSFASGDEVTNKEYSRNNSTEKNKGEWDFKINVMNAIGFPELIEIITGRSNQDEDVIVNLEEIVNYLKEQGVKNIVFFDLTCSPFVSVSESKKSSLMDIEDSEDDNDNDEENIENQRIVRRIRREHISKTMSKKAGGKKTKKQKQSRKRKQSRKKRTQTRKRKHN